MAKIETEITLRLTEDELIALKALLSSNHNDPVAFGLPDAFKDLLNGIHFELADNS